MVEEVTAHCVDGVDEGGGAVSITKAVEASLEAKLTKEQVYRMYPGKVQLQQVLYQLQIVGDFGPANINVRQGCVLEGLGNVGDTKVCLLGLRQAGVRQRLGRVFDGIVIDASCDGLNIVAILQLSEDCRGQLVCAKHSKDCLGPAILCQELLELLDHLLFDHLDMDIVVAQLG